MTDRPLAVVDVPLRLPRHAISPRQVARPGELWRLMQEAIVCGSVRNGWPPPKYLAQGVAFIVSAMTVRHTREVHYGEELRGRTWLSSFARDTLSTRRVQLWSGSEVVAEATARWVHVLADGSGGLRPGRASRALLESFPVHTDGPPAPELPHAEARHAGGQAHVFRFEVWQTTMDPLGHANHPAYLDWCDEGTSRALATAGVDATLLQPVAEKMRWRRGARAGAQVVVSTRLVGRTSSGEVVLEHSIDDADGRLATGTTVRALAGCSADVLADLFR